MALLKKKKKERITKRSREKTESIAFTPKWEDSRTTPDRLPQPQCQGKGPPRLGQILLAVPFFEREALVTGLFID